MRAEMPVMEERCYSWLDHPFDMLWFDHPFDMLFWLDHPLDVTFAPLLVLVAAAEFGSSVAILALVCKFSDQGRCPAFAGHFPRRRGRHTLSGYPGAALGTAPLFFAPCQSIRAGPAIRSRRAFGSATMAGARSAERRTRTRSFPA